MPEDTIEWPQKPGARIKDRATAAKKKPQVVASQATKISRRKLLGLGAKGTAAAFVSTALGRGTLANVTDIRYGVGAGTERAARSYKSLSRFFHKEPGAVQIEFAKPQNLELAKPVSEFYKVFAGLANGDLAKAKALVRQMHGVISGNSAYQNGSLYEVTRKFEPEILNSAEYAQINPVLAKGIIFIENGGGEAIVNPVSGAVGVAQLMPETAKRYGMRVDGQVDERKDPVKSIKVAGEYWKDLRLEFLGEDFAAWAYHSGEGNIYHALQVYFLDVDGVDYGNVVESDDPAVAEKYRKIKVERNLTAHKVLQNQRVQQEVLSKLADEDELYLYKAIAGGELFQANKAAFG